MSKQGDSGWLIRMPFLMLGSFIPIHLHTVRFLSYHKHEQSKKREYCECVRELVEDGVFTPLLFSTLGGMACEATVFYKQLAEPVSKKWEESYSVTMGWMRCRLSFASFEKCHPMGTRGSHSSFGRPVHDGQRRAAACG